jgi:hypothetical protein
MRHILFTLLLVSACKSDPVKSYDDFQACFDDQTLNDPALIAVDKILLCCLDHPIGGVTPACKTTKAECINFLTDNLKQTDASVVDLMDGCQMYVDMMMPPSM